MVVLRVFHSPPDNSSGSVESHVPGVASGACPVWVPGLCLYLPGRLTRPCRIQLPLYDLNLHTQTDMEVCNVSTVVSGQLPVANASLLPV